MKIRSVGMILAILNGAVLGFFAGFMAEISYWDCGVADRASQDCNPCIFPRGDKMNEPINPKSIKRKTLIKALSRKLDKKAFEKRALKLERIQQRGRRG